MSKQTDFNKSKFEIQPTDEHGNIVDEYGDSTTTDQAAPAKQDQAAPSTFDQAASQSPDELVEDAINCKMDIDMVALRIVSFHEFNEKYIVKKLVQAQFATEQELRKQIRIMKMLVKEGLEIRSNALDFVRQYFEKKFLKVAANGVITRDIRETMMANKDFKSKIDELRTKIGNSWYGAPLSLPRIAEEIDGLNIEYSLGFKSADIKSMVSKVFNDQKEKSAGVITASVLYYLDEDTDGSWSDDDFKKFFDAVFPEDTAPFIVKKAALQQFIWNVKYVAQNKRNLSHPLMIMLYGRHGAGKSRFVKWLSSPVGEMFVESKMTSYCDPASQSLKQDNLIIHLEEMAGSKKAEAETIKTTMESGISQSRAHYSHGSLTTYNRAQLIGSSNKEITEVIKDDTGNRRFIQFTLGKTNMNIDYGQFDVEKLWRSILSTDKQPMDDPAVKIEMAKIQDEQRPKNIIEEWFIANMDSFTGREIAKSKDDLFRSCREYAEQNGNAFDRANLKSHGLIKKIEALAKNNDLILVEKKNNGDRKYYLEF